MQSDVDTFNDRSAMRKASDMLINFIMIVKIEAGMKFIELFIVANNGTSN